MCPLTLSLFFAGDVRASATLTVAYFSFFNNVSHSDADGVLPMSGHLQQLNLIKLNIYWLFLSPRLYPIHVQHCSHLGFFFKLHFFIMSYFITYFDHL